MSFAVRVHCRDCYHEDPLGCFGGEDETLVERFATRDEAEEFAYAQDIKANGAPWEFEVIEVPA